MLLLNGSKTTQMEIHKIVSESGIRPSDIERMTGGEIRLPQASVMIKKAVAGGDGMNATTKWFLLLAAQIHSRGLYPEKQDILVDYKSAGKHRMENVDWPKESVTDKTRESLIRRAACGRFRKQAQATSSDVEPKPLAEYRPDQSGLNTMDAPMTKRFKGHVRGYGEAWVLYARKYKYILPLSRIKYRLILDEGSFSFSDFVEVR